MRILILLIILMSSIGCDEEEGGMIVDYDFEDTEYSIIVESIEDLNTVAEKELVYIQTRGNAKKLWKNSLDSVIARFDECGDSKFGETVSGDIAICVTNIKEYAKEPSSPLSYDKYLMAVFKHELGHLIGLDHSDDPNDIMHPYSLISYNYSQNDIQKILEASK